MQLYKKVMVLVAFLFIGLFTVNKLHPIPQVRTTFAANITIGSSTGSAGDYLVDGQGKSLYVFDKDPPLGSSCTDDCARVWPPLTAAESDTVGVSGSAQANRLGIPYIRLDGSRQVVYADHALYHYQGDLQPGDTKGNNLNSFGGRWCLVSTNGFPLCQSGGSTSSGTPIPGPTVAPTPIATIPIPGPTVTPTPTPTPTRSIPIPGPTITPTPMPTTPSSPPPPACTPCTCTLPGQLNCLDSCGRSFAC